MGELARGQSVEHAIEAADSVGNVACVADGGGGRCALAAGARGIDFRGDWDDLDIRPDGAKPIDGGGGNSDHDDAAGIERFQGAWRQAMFRIGMLPTDREAASAFDIAEDAAGHTDVLGVMGRLPRLQTGWKFQTWIGGVAAARLSDQKILSARFGAGQKDEKPGIEANAGWLDCGIRHALRSPRRNSMVRDSLRAQGNLASLR